MPSPQQQLLLIRLNVLDEDITKVAGAVKRAKQRGSKIEEIEAGLAGAAQLAGQESVTRRLTKLGSTVREVRGGLEEPDDFGVGANKQLLDRLAKQLTEVYGGLDEVRQRVLAARESLAQLRATIVLDDRVANENSLESACESLRAKVDELREQASAENLDGAQLRTLWRDYEKLLDAEGRPLFGEYVDFLGGLTMRDTELDDGVCGMTDALLSGFKTITRHYLPIPARQAALSNALESVVKLGFPEWSVWGVPLVAHEVGLALALARDLNQPGPIAELLDQWTNYASRERLAELFADIFAAYTVGPAYGCAVLLLRLHPHHDERPRDDEARDVDRAKLLLETLKEGGDPGTGFRETVDRLKKMWNDSVITLAGPGQAAKAKEAVGPLDENGWMDQYLEAVLGLLDRREVIERFGEQQWARALEDWGGELDRAGTMHDSAADVLAVLNLAWAKRLELPAGAADLDERVQGLWGAHQPENAR